MWYGVLRSNERLVVLVNHLEKDGYRRVPVFYKDEQIDYDIGSDNALMNDTMSLAIFLDTDKI